MFASGVKTFHDLEELEAGIFRDGSIDQKTKELIALGISISQSCYG
jgi:alkylhydroperoxidase/carboxymuconolactone decarboxylase family protein YurZ